MFSDDFSVLPWNIVCAQRLRNLSLVFSEYSLPIIFLSYFVSPCSGPQELGGRGSLNRLNPRFLRHCRLVSRMVGNFYNQCINRLDQYPSCSGHMPI